MGGRTDGLRIASGLVAVDIRMRRRPKQLSGGICRACSGENQLLSNRLTIASQKV